MMDSQQRHESKEIFFAYSFAKQPLLFFDGSVSYRATRDANKGWLPQKPEGTAVATKIVYVPDPGFESPPPVLETPEVLYGYYRWTRAGLHGIDFSGSEVSGLNGETFDNFYNN